MNKLAAVLILLVGLSLASCGGLGVPTALDSTAWELSDFPTTIAEGGRPITLMFDNGQVRGSAGCNSYGGDYRVRGDRIVFENIFATAMACPEPEGVMEREQGYLKFLTTVESYRISDMGLQLFGPDGQALGFISKGPVE